MKPVFAKAVTDEQSKAFWIVKVNQPTFYSGFHFHNECQITYIIESSGRRIFGDSIEPYLPEELTLFGANLPHAWYSFNNNTGDEGTQKSLARSISIFFDPNRLLEALSHFTNTEKLESLLSIAKRGMLFYGETKEKLKQLLLNIDKSKELSQLPYLMKMFEILCTTKEYELIVSEGYSNTYSRKDNDRFDRIVKYIFENFSNEIKLADIAAIGNMTRPAFCRYFKARTQKTFVEFVNTVRIANACKLLIQSNDSIGTIGYLCGYKNVSNFNKLFKLAKAVSPSKFRKLQIENR